MCMTCPLQCSNYCWNASCIVLPAIALPVYHHATNYEFIDGGLLGWAVLVEPCVYDNQGDVFLVGETCQLHI